VTKADRYLVTERYRGAIARQHFECGTCHAETKLIHVFCPGCGATFRTGYIERQVTR